MAKPKGLGRGLDALFGAGSADVSVHDQLASLKVGLIRPGRFQPRMQMDDESLQELADSISAQGVIQPIIVREVGLEEYEIIAGERRWRASQIAGLEEVPVVIKSITDEQALAIGLIENIQRQNLNPIEEAQGLKRLIDEFGMTHEKVAHAVGRSRSSITNSLRLLSLPEPVQTLLYARQLDMGHARALLTLPVLEQIHLGQKAAKMGWSVRDVERKSQELLTQKTKPKTQKKIDPDLVQLSEKLSQCLGTSVEIQTKNAQKGKIIVHFNSLDDFDRLLQQLGLEE
ncbi:ParB/RepB/Spo0J family partition protein [Neisseria sp. Ec49-e6-T10]|uniref:ParB/RepB/Spo0J family partition protein n=1 Tax=Neisseria sp. Ec49-e6-T10 TaxID=3140744 RepID=UPI003EBC8E8D